MAISNILMLSSLLLLLLQTPIPLALPTLLPGSVEKLDAIAVARNSLYRPHCKIFHPSSDSCVSRKLHEDILTLAPCEQCDFWNYTPQKLLVVVGTYYCLKAVGPTLPVKLIISCDPSNSQWTQVSGSQLTHISTKMDDGALLCLDVDEDNIIVTNPCRSFGSEGNSQWFQISTFGHRTGLGIPK